MPSRVLPFMGILKSLNLYSYPSLRLIFFLLLLECLQRYSKQSQLMPLVFIFIKQINKYIIAKILVTNANEDELTEFLFYIPKIVICFGE